MKTVCLSLVFLCAGNAAVAQDPRQGEAQMDSVVLDAVTITGILPLNNKTVLDLYRNNHFFSIDDLTSRIEGLTLIKRGAYALEPQLDGFSAGQLNITIDGMKIFGACTDKMDPVTSYVEPSNLKQIRMLHGTMAAEHGSNIGGAIDMSLHDPETEGGEPAIMAAGIGYSAIDNGTDMLLSSAFARKRLSFTMNTVYRDHGNYRNGAGEFVPHSQYDKVNVHAAAKYRPDSSQSIKADILYDRAGNVGYPALPMDVSLARLILGSMEFEKRARGTFVARIYANDVYHIMDDSDRDSVYFLRNGGGQILDTVLMRMDMPGRSTTWGAFAEYSVRLQNHRLLLKAENYLHHAIAEMTMYMHYQDAPPEKPMYMQTWPEMLRNVTGLFLQDTWTVSDRMMLSSGARIDYVADMPRNNLAKQQHSVFSVNFPQHFRNIAFNLNAGTKVWLTSRVSAALNLGVGERVPTLSERFGFYLYNAYDGYDYLGDPNLRLEKSAYTGFQFSFSGKSVRTSISQHFSFMRDYILGETDTTLEKLNFYAQGIRKYRNYDRARLFATNMQLVILPYPGWTLFSNLTYTYGSIDDDKPMPLIAPLKMLIALSYTWRNLTLKAESQSALSQHRISKPYGETNTPGFSVIHMNASWQITLDRSTLELSAGITNLFNRAYYEHLDWGHILRPGRGVEVYAGWRF